MFWNSHKLFPHFRYPVMKVENKLFIIIIPDCGNMVPGYRNDSIPRILWKKMVKGSQWDFALKMAEKWKFFDAKKK